MNTFIDVLTRTHTIVSLADIPLLKLTVALGHPDAVANSPQANQNKDNNKRIGSRLPYCHKGQQAKIDSDR